MHLTALNEIKHVRLVQLIHVLFEKILLLRYSMGVLIDNAQMVFIRTLEQIIAPVVIVHVVFVTALLVLPVRTKTRKFRDSCESARPDFIMNLIATPVLHVIVLALNVQLVF